MHICTYYQQQAWVFSFALQLRQTAIPKSSESMFPPLFFAMQLVGVSPHSKD
jgi:hypothetical protein